MNPRERALQKNMEMKTEPGAEEEMNQNPEFEEVPVNSFTGVVWKKGHFKPMRDKEGMHKKEARAFWQHFDGGFWATGLGKSELYS